MEIHRQTLTHAIVAFTMDVYTEVAEELADAAMEALAAYITRRALVAPLGRPSSPGRLVMSDNQLDCPARYVCLAQADNAGEGEGSEVNYWAWWDAERCL